LPAIAAARADSALYCLERELGACFLNSYARDSVAVRANRANEDRLFSAYGDYADRVDSAFEASAAIVSARESYVLCLPVTGDCYLPPSYYVGERQAAVFVLPADLAVSSLEDAANRREDLVYVQESN
jgi:hypothetical protein